MEPGAKEFPWVAQLTDKSKRLSWSGESDGTLEQMVLKMAVLGPGAKKDERNIVEVTTFDSKQQKIKSCICALSLGKTENMPLSDISLFPPVIFTLVEGSGPVHLTASYLVSEEDEFSDEDDLSEYEEEMMESKEKLNTKQKTNGKGDAPMKAIKGKKKVEEEDDDDDDLDDLDDDDSEEDDERKIASMKQKISSMLDMEADDDDDDMEDDSEDEEEEEEKAPAKKRKLANGQAAKAVEKKMTSPVKGKKNPPPEQKTPKSQKSENAQTPKSAKKTPAKPPKFNSVEEVKAAISKFPGGKPRKQDKFINWVQNQFKVSEDSWKNDLWKWHKKELGM